LFYRIIYLIIALREAQN